MPTIVAYRKFIDAIVTRELRLPEAEAPEAGGPLATELATIDGVTYVSLPHGARLPTDQPEEIAASIEVVTLSPELREAIKAASPHCSLIARRMVERIRARYSIDDEMYLARIGVGRANGMYSPSDAEIAEMAEFGSFVEDVRAWGRAERARLGL